MDPVVALEPLRNAVFALAAAVGALALFLLLQRSLAWITQRRAQRRVPLLTRLVYEAVQNEQVDSSALARLSGFDRRLVRSILLGLALDLRGDTGEALTELFRRLGFLRRDLARLRSWWAGRRANAAADLGLIKAREAAGKLLDALQDKDVRVRQAAVWALGQAGDASSLQRLVRVLGDRNLLVAHRAQEVLAERGKEVSDAIVSYAETTTSRAGRLAAIELIGWLRLSSAADLLLGLSSDMDPEIRVKSVKAAAAIGDPRFLDLFHSHLEDPSWPVRCQAAKGLSVFGSPTSVEPLGKALRDRQWWVRFYAATGLAEAGPSGEQALTQALNDPEPLVQDMARYLLERGPAVPALP